MTDAPDISVVMSVLNGAGAISETIDSILSQEGVSFEFIIVNDGSSDGTKGILDEYALRDSRVRIIHQENQGLTRALIAGCAMAKGEFIARQDCGDVSLPARLSQQRAALFSHPEAVMVSCGTEFVGPAGEYLYSVVQDDSALQNGLAALQLQSVRGPSHHGATMFRRDAYEAVGGYRACFYVAQDLDLWMRLSEIGVCLAIPDVYYRAPFTFGSISSSRRLEQIETAETILKSAVARRAGRSDAAILALWDAKPRRYRRAWQIVLPGMRQARFLYFIGCVLRTTQPRIARNYFLKSIRGCFPFIPAWVGLIRVLAAK